jgi:acylphosphatase
MNNQSAFMAACQDRAGPGQNRHFARVLAMDEPLVRRRVVARGLVQGVWFRDSVRERARAHGVSGWVRNVQDGSVEAVLEGPAEAVDRVVRFMEIGPPAARVEAVDLRDEEPEGLSGFAIH